MHLLRTTSCAGQSIFENRPIRGLLEANKVQNDQLMPVSVLARTMLGEARVDAVDLAALSPGDVIVLDSLAADPLRLLIGNCERFAGFPGTKGRKMALQVSARVDDDGWVKSFEDAENE